MRVICKLISLAISLSLHIIFTYYIFIFTYYIYFYMATAIPSLIPTFGAALSIAGIIFQIGKHTEKLDSIGFQVDALEKKDDGYNIFLNNIHTKLLLSEEKLKNIESDVKYIKGRIIK